MRILLLCLFLSYGFSQEEESCSELYQKIKASDCGQNIFSYLDGAELKIGFNLNTTSLNVENKDEVNQATLQGRFLPSPVFSLTFSPTYLFGTSIGYETSLGFQNLFGNQQVITRGEDTKVLDLNTYFAATMIFATPTLFYSFGGNDETPHTFMRIGFGLGLGYAWVEGTGFYTEHADSPCYEQGSQILQNKSSKAILFENCSIEKYSSNGFGSSSRLLLDFRYEAISISLDAHVINIIDNKHSLSPLGLSLGVLYWITL